MTLDELAQAALDRRSVVGFHAHKDKPMPAAFVIGMTGRVLHRALPNLKLYERPEDDDV